MRVSLIGRERERRGRESVAEQVELKGEGHLVTPTKKRKAET